MPYCKSCGAYIPDGLSACLACGFDEDAQRAAAAAAQKAEQEAERQRKLKQEEEDFARQEMERQRREQQERNRQWAEQERERRERQAENRQWAQEEYARRQAQREAERTAQEQEARARAEQDHGQSDPANQQGSASQGNTALAALSYFSFFFALPMLLTPKDEFAMYHAKQGLRLFIFGAIADLIGKLTGFGWILSIFRLYCIFKGIGNVLNGRKAPLPYIGNIGNF